MNTLYYFESCPYCTRVRAILGLKAIECQLTTVQLGQIPTELADKIDSLTVPILAQPQDGELSVMRESLDIVRYLDQQGTPALTDYQPSAELTAWLSHTQLSRARLCYPRYRQLNLPELANAEAIAQFERTRAERLDGSLDHWQAQTPALISQLEGEWAALPKLLNINALLSEQRAISIDDVCAFSELRNLSCVAELSLPTEVEQYLAKLYSRFAVAPLAPISQ